MIPAQNYPIGDGTISVVAGDITYETVDAIVNAARRSLLSGGGVDGAIHRAAGPELTAACKALGGCRTAHAKITPAFRLKSKWVIHAVGPVYKGGSDNEEKLLSQTYRSCYALADEYSLNSIAFPAISTGHYGYPFRAATKIAVDEAMRYLHGTPNLELIRFVLYGGDFFTTYCKIIEEALS